MKLRPFLLAAALAATAACGGDDAGGRSADETASLRIEVRDAEGAAPRTATLGCASKTEGTGFLADKAKADAACKAVLEDPAKAALISQPPPGDRACTMIFGGPQTARVTGTLSGRIVDRTFKRSNGCEIADWEALTALLGEPQGGAGVP